jgi:hypothetical protein
MDIKRSGMSCLYRMSQLMQGMPVEDEREVVTSSEPWSKKG